MKGRTDWRAPRFPFPEKCEAFGRKYGIPRAYGSYEELLRDEEVDAVYVVQLPTICIINCMACLEAGKYVM